MNKSIKSIRLETRGRRVVAEHAIDPGASWSGLVRTGEVLRIIDLEGQQAVDFLCYDAGDFHARYNAANTMKMARNVYLSTGVTLYSEYALPLMTIVADTCGGHDTIGGCCSAEMNLLRYGKHTPNCRANFLRELARYGRDERDLAANANFFMNVPVGRDGSMAIADGQSKAGDYVDLRADCDVIAMLSNCPQRYNPAAGYDPSAVRVVHFARARRKGSQERNS